MAPLPYKPRWDADGELVSDNDRLTDEHAQASWAVQDLQCMRRQVTAADLALLPRSAHGLCIATTSERPLSVLIHVADAQGLSEAVRVRMSEWRLAAPCEVELIIPQTLSDADLQAGIIAALSQLEGLPADSTVQLDTSSINAGWPAIHASAVQAIAAAAPSLPQLTVLPPKFASTNITPLCDPEYPLRHAVVRDLPDRWGVFNAHAEVPWSWQSLRVAYGISLAKVLDLPNPCLGQYEIWASTLYLSEVTSSVLRTRLGHLSFRVSSIECTHDKLSPSRQPAALSKQLEQLRYVRASPQPGHESAGITVNLQGWDITPALMTTLHRSPSTNGPFKLLFKDCKWQLTPTQYQGLLAAMPASYGTVDVRVYQGPVSPVECPFGPIPLDWTMEHFQAVCVGVRQRVEAGWPVKLCLNVIEDRSDEERAMVLDYIEEQRLSEWVQVRWCVKRY